MDGLKRFGDSDQKAIFLRGYMILSIEYYRIRYRIGFPIAITKIEIFAWGSYRRWLLRLTRKNIRFSKETDQNQVSR
jgi:hypothetical protein